MKNIALAFCLCIMSSMAAQQVKWNMHPLNLDQCPQWIYPENCSGCSSCRMAQNTEPTVIAGEMLYWSPDIHTCPYPIGNEQNVVVLSGWPVQSDTNAFFSSLTFVHAARTLDTLEIIYGRQNNGCDTAQVSISINGGPRVQLEKLGLESYYPYYDTLRITDVGCVPVGFFQVFISASGGTTTEFLMKQIRMVASDCAASTTFIGEQTRDDDFVMTSMDGGIEVTTFKSLPVMVYDGLGRLVYGRSNFQGRSTVSIGSGLHIVQIGTQVKRIISR